MNCITICYFSFKIVVRHILKFKFLFIFIFYFGPWVLSHSENNCETLDPPLMLMLTFPKVNCRSASSLSPTSYVGYESSTVGKGHEIKCGAFGNTLGGVDTFKTCGIWWEHHGNFMGMSRSHEFNALEFDGSFMGTSKSQKFKPVFPSQKRAKKIN